MMLPQGIEVEQQDLIVTCRVGVPGVTHLDLQEAVDECVERMRYSNAQHFIFDFTGVDFLSSACVGVLVSFLQDVAHVRGRIAITGCNDQVAFLFRVTRLDVVFAMHDEVADAVAYFRHAA